MQDERGIAVNEIEDKTAFREAVQPVYDNYVQKFGSDRLDKIVKLIDTVQ